jgi:hypothetical protein
VQNVNFFPNGILVKDEVEYLDMLRALMLKGVGRQVDNTGIVAIDKCAVGQREVQLHE